MKRQPKNETDVLREELNFLREYLRQEEEKHRNTMKEIGGFIIDLLYDKNETFTRSYINERLAKIYYASIGEEAPGNKVELTLTKEKETDNE